MGCWILKPAFDNRGNGIELITDIKQFKNDYIKKKDPY